MIQIDFAEPEKGILNISKMEIVWGCIDSPRTEMRRCNFGETWSATFADMPQGTNKYRFLVNGLFTLNDPDCNIYEFDENEKLWSAIVIDSNGNRLYNNEQYNVNVESVKLLKDYRETSDEQTLIFSTYDTEHIVARYEFTDVTGVHTASVVWINPNGRISAWAEEIITHTDDSNYVWFGLNTADMEQSDSGEWRILLFIDGRYVLTNFFNVSCEKKKAIHSFNVII